MLHCGQTSGLVRVIQRRGGRVPYVRWRRKLEYGLHARMNVLPTYLPVLSTGLRKVKNEQLKFEARLHESGHAACSID